MWSVNGWDLRAATNKTFILPLLGSCSIWTNDWIQIVSKPPQNESYKLIIVTLFMNLRIPKHTHTHKTLGSLKHLTPYMGEKLCTDWITSRDEFASSRLGWVRFDGWSLDHSEWDRDCVCVHLRVPCVERVWRPMPYIKKMEMYFK